MDGWPGDRIAVSAEAGRLVAAWSISQGAALTIACLARTISVLCKSVSVIISDDLGGSENAETVSPGFDGVTCEIDLGKKNRSRLKRALAPFIEAGRRAPRSSRRRGASRPWWLTCGPQRRAGLGQGGWPEGLRARPDQRRHHTAVRRGLLGRNLRDLGCAGRAVACADAGSGGWLGGCAGFWRKSGTGAPGSSKTRRWTGCVDGEFLGFAARRS